MAAFREAEALAAFLEEGALAAFLEEGAKTSQTHQEEPVLVLSVPAFPEAV